MDSVNPNISQLDFQNRLPQDAQMMNLGKLARDRITSSAIYQDPNSRSFLGALNVFRWMQKPTKEQQAAANSTDLGFETFNKLTTAINTNFPILTTAILGLAGLLGAIVGGKLFLNLGKAALGLGGAGAAATTGVGGAAGVLTKLGKGVPFLSGLLTGGLHYMQGDSLTKSTGAGMGSMIGSMAGLWLGRLAGGLLATPLGGPLGAIAGGIGGGYLGEMAGSWLGGKIDQILPSLGIGTGGEQISPETGTTNFNNQTAEMFKANMMWQNQTADLLTSILAELQEQTDDLEDIDLNTTKSNEHLDDIKKRQEGFHHARGASKRAEAPANRANTVLPWGVAVP